MTQEMRPFQQPTVGVAVVTYFAEKQIERCLTPFLTSPLKPRLLVIDSSSPDGTASSARALGAEVYLIPRSQFNHGATRELARTLLNCDIVVMCTQDAFGKGSELLELLIDPILRGKAAVAYARQLPHVESHPLGSFARQFNYPPESQLRELGDLKQYGSYTFFCSNSCAAYSNDALNEVGGFGSYSIAEDSIAAAKLLHRGYAIAYVAEAEVFHSHDFTLKEELCRYFLTGAARWKYRHWLEAAGSDRQRGSRYAKQLLMTLWKTQRSLLPYGCLHLIVKWLGYYSGRYFAYLRGYIYFHYTESDSKF